MVVAGYPLLKGGEHAIESRRRFITVSDVYKLRLLYVTSLNMKTGSTSGLKQFARMRFS